MTIISYAKIAGENSALIWAWNDEYSPVVVCGFLVRGDNRGDDFGADF